MADYNIRSNSLKLLSYLYLKCNTTFECKDVDCTPLFNDAYTAEDHNKATCYLSRSKFIETREICAKIMNCTITVKGIDWVEDSQNH